MKKLFLATVIVFGMTLGASAQYFNNDNGQVGGGFFGRGEMPGTEMDARGGMLSPGLPGHGQSGNQDAPLGGGALLLAGFGAAYAMAKRNRK